jgi:hypothetical protein
MVLPVSFSTVAMHIVELLKHMNPFLSDLSHK